MKTKKRNSLCSVLRFLSQLDQTYDDEQFRRCVKAVLSHSGEHFALRNRIAYGKTKI